MKRKLVALLISICCIFGMMGMIACGEGTSSGEKSSSNGWGTTFTVKTAYAEAKQKGYAGSLEEFIAMISGKDGVDGSDGTDGVGIVSVAVDKNGVLTVTLSNGEKINCGVVVGKDGSDGSDGEKGDQGEKGEPGEKGDQGEKGENGVGISSVYFNEKNELVVEYTDENTLVVGEIPACVHNYGEWTVKTETTCVSIGLQYRTCSLCENTEYEIVPATEHIFDYTYFSYTNSGHSMYCEICRTSFFMEHNYGDWQFNTERHWKECACGIMDTEKHTFDENGFCTVCKKADHTVGLEYILSDDGTYYGVEGIGNVKDKDIVIPAIYNEKPVTSINRGAFWGCSELTSITIPNSITSIEPYAFLRCSGLTSVAIGSGVVFVGEDAFKDCSGLKNMYISDIVAWCQIEFEPPTSLGATNPLGLAENIYIDGEIVTDLVIPNGVTSIGNYAFQGCDSLTSISIPDSVMSIGDYAFYSCDGLTGELIIPNSVTSIGEEAFSYCYGLMGELVIPNSVTSIGEGAFACCYGLTTVCIGNNVMSIGNSAFFHCEELTSVIIGGSVISIGNSAFDMCDKLSFVYLIFTEADCAEIDFGYNALPSSRYYYSEVEQAGCWRYVNGEPTIW